MCAYEEVLELGGILECVDFGDSSLQNITSIKLRTVEGFSCNQPKVGGLSNFLRTIYSLRSGATRMDEDWYILWQVVRVVHIFATKCVCWDVKGENRSETIYSLDRLCRKVDISIEEARKMLNQTNFPSLEKVKRKRKRVARKTIKRNL